MQGLLRVVQCWPFDDDALWRAVFGVGATLRCRDVERLKSVVRGVVWRHSKASVASAFALPERSLQHVPLHMPVNEEEIYKHVLGEMLKLRDALLGCEQGGAEASGSAAHSVGGRGSRRRVRGSTDPAVKERSR
jgi:hypothetical protein